MIKLYQFPRPANVPVPSFSPFCIKLEMYCKLAKIPYENVFTLDLSKSPKGKMPYIEIDGKFISDSTLIIEHLCKLNPEWDLNADLTPEQKALSHCVQLTLDESLSYCSLRFRWLEEDVWPQFRKRLFHGAPEEIEIKRGAILQEGVKLRLKEQGYGLHSRDEVYNIAKQDIHFIATLLGSKKFFFGEKPHSIDCNIFALIASIVSVDFISPLKDLVLPHANLLSHVEKMHQCFLQK